MALKKGRKEVEGVFPACRWPSCDQRNGWLWPPNVLQTASFLANRDLLQNATTSGAWTIYSRAERRNARKFLTGLSRTVSEEYRYRGLSMLAILLLVRSLHCCLCSEILHSATILLPCFVRAEGKGEGVSTSSSRATELES